MNAVTALPDVPDAIGAPVTYSFRASGALQRQIEQGAPVDVFISAAVEKMDALELNQHLLPGTRRNLLENPLTPLVLPPTVVGFGLLLAIGRNGPVGQLLQYGGLRLVFTWYAAVFTAAVVAFPLFYRAAIGAFKQIDPALLDAARVEGTSEWAVFGHIALPLAFLGILAGTLLTLARALGEFGATLMLAGNVPGQTQTIPIAIYFAVEAGALKES